VASPSTHGRLRPHAHVEQVFTSSKYGVRFVYPLSWKFKPDRNASDLGIDFVNKKGAVVLGTVEIASSLYPGTNFTGGSFAMSVSPSLTNPAACHQFASGEPDRSVTVHGVLYSVYSTEGVGGGQYRAYKILHTWQNGFCYEMTFQIGTYNKGNLDDPSSVREFTNGAKIRSTLLGGISFFQPAAKRHPDPIAPRN
jgi:hypothetical protein